MALKFPMNDDIIEYMTPHIGDAFSNPAYLSKCHRNSVAVMVKLGYMMPVRFCTNCIEIKRCLEDYVMPELDYGWINSLMYEKKLSYADLFWLIKNGYATIEEFIAYFQ
jgi:hypothetical protein